MSAAAADHGHGHGEDSSKKWWFRGAVILFTGFAIYLVSSWILEIANPLGTNVGSGLTNLFLPLPRAREGIGMLVPIGVNIAIAIAAITLALSIGKDDKKILALQHKIDELEAAAAKAKPAAAAH